MKNLLLIAQREYLTRVTKRSFIIATLLIPLGFVALMAVQFIVMAYSSNSLRVAVVNQDTKLFAEQALSDDGELFFVKSNLPLDTLRNRYQELGFDGILLIPPINIDNPNGFKYISDKVLGMAARTYIQHELEDEVKRLRLQTMGINSQELNQRINQLSLNIVEEDLNGKNTQGTALATGVGMGMGFLMYMVIFIYGAMVMRGVMEEKTNRIVEVMLSAVRPFDLMVGKIWGIGLVGLTQFMIWFVFLFIINLTLGTLLGVAMPTSDMDTQLNSTQTAQAMSLIEEVKNGIDRLPVGLLVFGFAFYFVLGYTLYAALFAGLASAINDDSDAQSLTFPISVPIILAIFILSAVAENPSSGLAFWSSMIPLFAPIIMPFRIAFGVPAWELALSMCLMLLGTWAAIWLAAKIYRTAILLYGKKINFKEIGKWVVKG